MVVAQCVPVDTFTDVSSGELVSALCFHKYKEFKSEKIERHLEIAKKDATRQTNTHWSEKVQFDEKFFKKKPQLIETMTKYTTMQDEHLERTPVAKERIHIKQPDVHLVHARLYCSEPRQRPLKKGVVEMILKIGAAWPAKTNWASFVVFFPRKYGSLKLCVEYRRLNAVTIRDSYPISRTDERKEFLEEASIYRLQTPAQATGKLRWTRKTQKRRLL